MRRSLYSCLVMLFMSLALQAKDRDVVVAEALLERLLPSYVDNFQFQKLKGKKRLFYHRVGKRQDCYCRKQCQLHGYGIKPLPKIPLSYYNVMVCRYCG